MKRKEQNTFEPAKVGHNKVLRLWMVNQYAATRQMASGTRHVELAQLLKAHRWSTEIFASRDGRGAENGVFDDSDEELITWVYSVPFRSNGIVRYLNMLSFFCCSLLTMVRCRKPDVVIGSSPHLLSALSALAVARLKRTPFVLEIRDMWPDSLIQLGMTSPFITGPLRFIERLLYRNSVQIIALTDGIRSRIIEKGVDEARIALIPNASLRPEPLDPAHREKRRAQLGWTGKSVVLWTGAHNLANGLEHVIEAARLLQSREDILFIFIGRGTEKPRLIQQAAALSNIEFWDPVSKENIAGIMRAGDIGILNSRAFDAFSGARPNKMFEYMANGLAIVNALPGEASRLVQAAKAGVDVEWENPASISEGILILADDRERRVTMGNAGHEYVSLEHSREDTADELNDLLLAVLRERRRG